MRRTYIGRQGSEGSGGQVHVHDAGCVSPLVNRGRHRTQGFGWGGQAAGSISLARSILWDVLGAESGDGIAAIFAGDVIARLPRDAFALDERDVRSWLRSQRAPRLTSVELVEHLGTIALAEPEEEAETLRELVDRCWSPYSLVN